MFVRSEHDQEVVILSHVLAHVCNIGYDSYRNMALRAVNGVPVRNLQHTKTLVEQAAAATAAEAQGGRVVFEFCNDAVIVLDGHEALRAQAQVHMPRCSAHCFVMLALDPAEFR